MKRIDAYNGEMIKYIETSTVQEGVTCDVYEFVNSASKDLGIINISKGFRSPRQLIVGGEETYQIHRKGEAILRIWKSENTKEPMHVYHFPGDAPEVLVEKGNIMEWQAIGDMEYAEICVPPYKDGRFKNLPQE